MFSLSFCLLFWSSFWLAISEPGWTSRKKPHLESGSNQRGRAKSVAPPVKSFVKTAIFVSRFLGCALYNIADVCIMPYRTLHPVPSATCAQRRAERRVRVGLRVSVPLMSAPPSGLWFSLAKALLSPATRDAGKTILR